MIVRVIVTALVMEIVVIITMLMVVVLIVLLYSIVFNLILVKRMKVVIVLLAALVLVLVRTTIICGSKLNIDTNPSNRNSCGSTTTIATININVNNHEISSGSHNRVSTHTNIDKKMLVIVLRTA